MRLSTIVAVLALLFASLGDVRAQSSASAATGRIVGSVRAGRLGEAGTAAEGVTVELTRHDSMVARTLSASDGQFVLKGIRPGDYTLRIRYIGHLQYRQPIRMADSVVRVDVRMQRVERPSDSEIREEFQRKLASARARPRHWSCTVDSTKFSEARSKAYETFMKPDGRPSASAVKFGMSRNGSDFNRDYRQLTPAECVRLAVAVDRQEGLIEDVLVAFRIGRVFWLPELTGGAALTDLSGKISLRYVWLN